ncbi:MAG: hypothetical protein LBK50_00360 [Candidatus Nomurabacteria bacterium]|nr:hypothetical protein [Candidatus Nomurabacteria bacterium]
MTEYSQAEIDAIKRIGNGPIEDYEKRRKFASEKISMMTALYVQNKIKNATIKIGANPERSASDLIYEGLLEGWCWQSANTLGVLFNDSDTISRGKLDLNSGNYPHSWIEFGHRDQDFVFDPALSILSKKEKYYELLSAEKKQEISAAMARKTLISLIGDSKEPICIKPINDLADPFFRMDSEVEAHIKGNKVKKIKAHFYYDD